ncbi:MAG: ORF6N domain-containing protein [Candidatus Omnitrophica bacterium]|nr:ORF6N domain-containing protein [Candidatus Omnitrophota bacterium]
MKSINATISPILSHKVVESKIYLIRNKRVMLDKDLALLYGTSTKSLNLAVKRNKFRFPDDFMFKLTTAEYASLRFQFETSKTKGGRRYVPYAFTEQGVAMLSSVLNSRRAIEVNIQIMRTFTQLREMLVSNEMLRTRIEKIEEKFLATIEENDARFKIIFDTIKKMLTPDKPGEEKKRIGFHHN